MMGLSAIFFVVSNPSLDDIVIGSAFLAFLYAIWLATEGLNGSSEFVKTRMAQSSKKIKPILLYLAAGILIYKLLNIVAGNA